jgi:large subunit ribosomal protein L23
MTKNQNNTFRDYDVIRRPLLTEKSNFLTGAAQYCFVVSLDANKGDIKKAVENIFQVKVASVNTLIKKGKKKVFRGRRGVQSDIKKAMVRLQDGYKLDIAVGV